MICPNNLLGLPTYSQCSKISEFRQSVELAVARALLVITSSSSAVLAPFFPSPGAGLSLGGPAALAAPHCGTELNALIGG